MATESDGLDGGAYRAVFEAAPEAVLVHDDGGGIRDANGAAAELFGQSRERLCSQSLRDLHPGTDVEGLRADAVETGTARAEWELDSGDGTHWVDVRLEAVDGHHRLTFLQEVTDRRKLEADLRREQGVTERVLDTAPTGIVVHDAAGDITMANPRAEEILGLGTSERTGREYDATVELRRVDGEAFTSEELPFARIEAAGEPITGEQVKVSTPGGERILAVSGAPLWDDGAFDGAVMSIQDVTSEFETRERIREQRDHLEAVIGNLPVVLFALDPEGTFTMSRGRGLRKLGLEQGELNGASVFDVYAEYPDIVEACELALEGEHVQTRQRVDGLVFETQYQPVTDDDGALTQVIGVSLDVTEQMESQQRLQTLLETIPAGVFMADTDGEVEFINDNGVDMIEPDVDDPEGRRMDEILSADQVEPFRRHHAAAIEEDGPVEREHTFGTGDGERALQAVVAPVTDASGDATGVVGVAQDATERKERERELEENEAILSQLTRTEDIIFWLFDGDFSELRFVNEAYEDIWGRSIEDLREDSTDFMEGVHPEDREIVAGEMARLQNGEETEAEYRVNPDEDYGRWVWVRGEPILGEDGEVERVAGIARDITGRKEREQERRRSERQFDAVFNDPQLLVGILDTDGTIRQVNDTALEYAAADRSQMQGQHFAETPWWNHDEALQADLREWLDRAADGEYVEFEATHPLPGGGEVDVEGSLRPVTDVDGEVRSLIASSRDVTERKERERALEKSNERLEQFAYVASHDLQEPLRTVSNYTEMLVEDFGDDLDDEATRFMEVVVTASERMQSMINGLLDYSRVTTRGDEFEPVDTEAVVASVEDDLAVMLEEEDGTLSWGDLPAIEADSDQFRQLVQNLVKNALEHAEESVAVEVRGEERADAYRFEIEDDGPGIAPSRQEKIFRIFKSGTQYQTSSQAKGIGLAICDNIVQRHDGDIWVESDPGEGATFVFTVAKPDDTNNDS